tara:strand:- start:1361 stop:1636 length:276 start_codon:yes stop_codon:yes gene_type:complete
VNDDEKILPWWCKVLLGFIVMLGLYKFTPILECLYLFMMVVLVPLTFFTAVGIISDGTYEAMRDGVTQVFVLAREKAAEAFNDTKSKKQNV